MQKKDPGTNDLPNCYVPNFIKSLDQRTAAARVLRERAAQVTSDLGGDLSYQQQSLVNRWIFLEALTQNLEHDMTNGVPIDFDQYAKALNALAKLSAVLGIRRVAKKMSLVDVIRNRKESKVES